MNLIFEALNAIKADPAFKDLDEQTKLKISKAAEVAPLINIVGMQAAQYSNQVARAQLGKFIGFKTDQGRFLSREVDRYGPCSNERL